MTRTSCPKSEERQSFQDGLGEGDEVRRIVGVIFAGLRVEVGKETSEGSTFESKEVSTEMKEESTSVEETQFDRLRSLGVKDIKFSVSLRLFEQTLERLTCEGARQPKTCAAE
jgi:hypothetical protein